MYKGNDIQERLIDFAVTIIKVTEKLPKSDAGKHISNQLMRSGTSPASNYAEARSAESKKDFVHKLKIALKELNESKVWLQILQRSKMIINGEYNNLYKENDELCRIINASIKTTKLNIKNE